MRALVTGASGFIGSHLVDRLLNNRWEVVGIDNFSTGQRSFLHTADTHPQFKLIQGDLLEPSIFRSLSGDKFDWIFHLSANADVRFGLDHPRKDLEQNTIVTSNILEFMRQAEIPNIAFSSTGSVYGEAAVIPTPEDCPFPIQTSLYAASKLACEGMISAYTEGYGMRGLIFRFVSILGERYTHGHIFDFIKALRQDSHKLKILGNGQQRKSYLYVHDCIDAILHLVNRPAKEKCNIYNLGTNEYITVNQSIDFISNELHIDPERLYTGGDRGWVGDNPFIFLDCKRIRETGWKPKYTIEEGIRRTVCYLIQNPSIFDARS